MLGRTATTTTTAAAVIVVIVGCKLLRGVALGLLKSPSLLFFLLLLQLQCQCETIKINGKKKRMVKIPLLRHDNKPHVIKIKNKFIKAYSSSPPPSPNEAPLESSGWLLRA